MSPPRKAATPAKKATPKPNTAIIESMVNYVSLSMLVAHHQQELHDLRVGLRAMFLDPARLLKEIYGHVPELPPDRSDDVVDHAGVVGNP